MYTSNNTQRRALYYMLCYIGINENVVALIEKSHCIHSIPFAIENVWINSCLEIMSLSSCSFCLVRYSEYVLSFQPTKSIRNWRIDVKPLKMTSAITLKAYTLLVATPRHSISIFSLLTTWQFLFAVNRIEYFIVKSIKLNESPEFPFITEIILQFRHVLICYNRIRSDSDYSGTIQLILELYENQYFPYHQ